MCKLPFKHSVTQHLTKAPPKQARAPTLSEPVSTPEISFYTPIFLSYPVPMRFLRFCFTLAIISALRVPVFFAQANDDDTIPTDLHAFCEENVRVGSAMADFEVSEDQLETLIQDHDESAARKKTHVISPWFGSLYPNEWLRFLNHERRLNYYSPDHLREYPSMGGDSSLTLLQYLQDLEHLDINRSRWSTSNAKRLSDEHADYEKRILKVSQNNARGACLLFSLGLARVCSESLFQFNQWMTPTQTAIHLFPLVEEKINDPVFASGALRAAIHVETRIEATEHGLKNRDDDPTGDLLTDLTAGFREVTQTDDEALNGAFQLLALYSTHGPISHDFLRPLITRENYPLFYALSVIGTGMTVLNSKTALNLQQYSYPLAVHGGCDNGKPYHFWMAAYLARESLKKYGNPKAATLASYLAEAGYQFQTTTLGHVPGKWFTLPCRSIENDRIRLDLAWAAAGAYYGATGNEISADDVLTLSLKSIKCDPPISEAESKDLMRNQPEAFLRWNRLFSTHAIVDQIIR